MKSRFSKLLQLSLQDCRCIMHALFLLPFNGVSVQLRGYQKTLNGLSTHQIENNRSRDISAIVAAKNMGRMVNIAARYGPYRAKCLTRSITVIQMMNRRGLSGGAAGPACVSPQHLLDHRAERQSEDQCRTADSRRRTRLPVTPRSGFECVPRRHSRAHRR